MAGELAKLLKNLIKVDEQGRLMHDARKDLPEGIPADKLRHILPRGVDSGGAVNESEKTMAPLVESNKIDEESVLRDMKERGVISEQDFERIKSALGKDNQELEAIKSKPTENVELAQESALTEEENLDARDSIINNLRNIEIDDELLEEDPVAKRRRLLRDRLLNNTFKPPIGEE